MTRDDLLLNLRLQLYNTTGNEEDTAKAILDIVYTALYETTNDMNNEGYYTMLEHGKKRVDLMFQNMLAVSAIGPKYKE